MLRSCPQVSFPQGREYILSVNNGYRLATSYAATW